MRMLRWSSSVTLKDRIRNEHVRGSMKVEKIDDKLVESRLRWYGHVMRRSENHLIRRVLNETQQKRGPGRPKTTWLSTVEKDMRSKNLESETTQDRLAWRRCTRANPT
ncbi:hypothetical protein DMENIID0001_009010 [Sergentomyia squamirostris]